MGVLKFKLWDRVKLIGPSEDNGWCGLYEVYEEARRLGRFIECVVTRAVDRGPHTNYYYVQSDVRWMGGCWRNDQRVEWSVFEDMLDFAFHDYDGADKVSYRCVMPSGSILRTINPKMPIPDRVSLIVGRNISDLDYKTDWSLIRGHIKSTGEQFTILEV